MASTYRNCPKLEKFGGVEVVSQDGLTFPNWNKKLKPLFHQNYVEQGGAEDLKTWASNRWFSRRPAVPEVFGANRFEVAEVAEEVAEMFVGPDNIWPPNFPELAEELENGGPGGDNNHGLDSDSDSSDDDSSDEDEDEEAQVGLEPICCIM